MKNLTQEIFKNQPDNVDWAGVDYDGMLHFGIAINPRYTWASERWRGFEKIGEPIKNSGYEPLTSIHRNLLKEKKRKLEKLKELHESMWEEYGSEFSAGDMLKQEKKLDYEIKILEGKNPYKIGDYVKILADVKDDYEEVWFKKGAILKINKIVDDGDGLIFKSNLGTHYTNVELA